MILTFMKEQERSGADNVQQHEIVEAIIQRVTSSGTSAVSIERTLELKKQLQNIISHLVSKENVLMITQDAKTKDERYLSLNINVDLENLQTFDASNQ